MCKNLVSVLCGCLLSLGISAQSTSITSILDQVDQNNLELKALSELMESKRLELKASNNLPNPQLGAYYLPFGDHNSGDYTEIQISQTFEFPTIYGIRNDLIQQQAEQLELNYKAKRQDILAQAKAYCLRLIYLNKRITAETLRTERAQTVFDQVRELYNQEQIGILELNKANVAWLQEQFKVQQALGEKKGVMLRLTELNGGNEISFTSNEYEAPLNLTDKKHIWQEKQAGDPELAQLKQQEVIVRQALRLAKNNALPNLTAGFNQQGVSGAYYSGVYAGVSIPLWSNRHKVKAAQSLVSFQQSFTSSRTMKEKAEFETQFNDYELMFSRFREYEATLSGLNSDDLLLQAYQLGELSFLEYYMELQFYREAYDTMLDMEYQLYISQNQLLKHQL